MSTDRFFKDSFTLTISNIVTGIIGFIFSIVLSRKLGAEGLGLYGLVMPVYVLLLCLTNEGLVTAVSKITAVYFHKRDYRNLNKTLATAFIFFMAWSIGIATITLLSASGIAAYIVKDIRVANSIRIICPALVFVPLGTIIKGCFYGIGKFKTAAYIDILEKCLRVLILLSTISILSLKSVESIVSAAYLALAGGELTSLIILFAAFKIQKRNITASGTGFRTKSRIQLLFDIVAISIPLSINGLISSVLSTASTLILPRRLMKSGFTYSSALSEIGRFSGMALNIVYLPFIIVGSMITVLVPDLSLKLSKKDIWAVENRIIQVLKVSALVGATALIICINIPDSLGLLFYGRDDLAGMITFAALCGFPGYISSPTFGILNAMGKQKILLRNSIIISVENLILVYFLTGIPKLNIYGFGICLIVTSVTAFILNMYEITKDCELRFRISELASIILSGILTYLIIQFLFWIMPPLTPVLSVLFTVPVASASIYLLSRLTYTPE